MKLKNVMAIKSNLMIADVRSHSVVLKPDTVEDVLETEELMNSYKHGDLRRMIDNGHVKEVNEAEAKKVVKKEESKQAPKIPKPSGMVEKKPPKEEPKKQSSKKGKSK